MTNRNVYGKFHNDEPPQDKTPVVLMYVDGLDTTMSWTPKMRQLAKVEPCP